MPAEPQPKPSSPLPERARPAKAHIRDAAVDPPDYLPARMLNEFVYCPRLFFYEWVEGVFVHSADTVEGAHRHQRVDKGADALPAAQDLADEDEVTARGVQLASETYRLIAKMDLVETADGRVTPVDYKKGRPRDTDDGPDVWPADRAQIAVQAIVLRENGYRCDEAIVYYSATKQRVRVAVTDELVRETVGLVEAARALAAAGPHSAAARRQPEVSALLARRDLSAGRDRVHRSASPASPSRRCSRG